MPALLSTVLLSYSFLFILPTGRLILVLISARLSPSCARFPMGHKLRLRRVRRVGARARKRRNGTRMSQRTMTTMMMMSMMKTTSRTRKRRRRRSYRRAQKGGRSLSTILRPNVVRGLRPPLSRPVGRINRNEYDKGAVESRASVPCLGRCCGRVEESFWLRVGYPCFQ